MDTLMQTMCVASRYVHFGASSSLLAPVQPGLAQPAFKSPLPPLLFDLEAEHGAELINLAQDPACASLTLECPPRTMHVA